MIVDTLPDGPRLLSYCTNVHPGESVEEILGALRQHAVPLRRRFPDKEPFGLGLRLGERAVRELQETPSRLEDLLGFLGDHSLAVYTLNVFPQGAFHGDSVKEQVYQPDWTRPERAAYTRAAAGLLARLLPADQDYGTLSTLPVGHGLQDPGSLEAAAGNLAAVAADLARLEGDSGNLLQLCLEPEPLCVLETSSDLVAFFKEHLLPAARRLPAVAGCDGEEQVRRHLGVCYDTCHMAVGFEEAGYNLQRLRREGIQVGKIQLSSALEVRRPGENPEGLSRLAEFQEERFLHQVIGRDRRGKLLRYPDLPDFLRSRQAAGAGLEVARCHFHVPIHLPDAFPLGTTQAHLLEVLNAQRLAPEVRHLEVETYTFELLPHKPVGKLDLVDDLENEIRFAWGHLAGGTPAQAP